MREKFLISILINITNLICKNSTNNINFRKLNMIRIKN